MANGKWPGSGLPRSVMKSHQLKCRLSGYVLLSLAGLLLFSRCSEGRKTVSEGESCFADAGLEQQVQALLDRMTLREKVDEMSAPPLSAQGFIELALLPHDIGSNERLGIPALRLAGSSRGAYVNGTCFPVSVARGASWNVELEERVGEALGAELEAAGGNVLLGPTINLLRHPGWGRSQETYGEDPYHLARMGVASVRGIQQHVMAQVKHFALNSIEDDRGNIDILVDERTLREVYLPHFRAVVQEGCAASIMSSYNKVNGEYMGENRHLLRDILKGEWGFKGFVASDWYTGTRSTVGAANNGLDVEMPFEQFYGDALYQAVLDGDVEEAVIDDAVSRILRAKFAFGLFDGPPRLDPGVIQSPRHTELALEAAREGIVLLKNEGGALPLTDDSVRVVAVLGPLADQARLGDLGSSTVLPHYAVSPLQGLLNHAGSIEVISYTGLDPAEAAEVAAKADAAVIIAALTPYDEGEQGMPFESAGGDRTDLGLHPEDIELITAVAKVSDRVVVVLEAGGAVTVDSWVDEVEGLFMAWYPGMEGGNAIAEVLFGDVNPSGKLPMTGPHEDDPLYEFGTQQPSVEYGYFHGYRYFDNEGLNPMFPFGFGLSYAGFEYQALSLSDDSVSDQDTIGISFDVTNTGSVAGKEVAQLYVGFPAAGVVRPLRELRAFTKVHLAPGETRRLEFELAAGDLAYYDAKQGKWVVEKGPHVVYAGSSSRDLPLQATFGIH